MRQQELLPPATKLEQNRAALKARIARHTRQVFKRSDNNNRQLRLKLVHRVGRITGQLAELIVFVYQGLRYQVFKALDNPMIPMQVVHEVLGVKVSYHSLYYLHTYREEYG